MVPQTNIQNIEAPKSPEQREQREKLEKEFNKNKTIDKSFIENNTLLNPKDKETIISRIITEYGKNKQSFDIKKSFEKIFFDESLSLSIFPQGPKNGETYMDFKKRVVDEKKNLYDKIIWWGENKGQKPEWTEKQQVKNPDIQDPKTDIIKRLFETNNITTPLEQIIDKNWKINLENKDIKPEDKQTIEWFIKNLDPKNKVNNISNLKEDSKNIPELKDNYEIKTKDDWFEAEVLNKIWWNYIKFPDKDMKNNPEADLQTAIKTTKNEILTEVKNIKYDSETYKTAIKNINSWDLKTQLEWINSLYALAYSNEWTLTKKSIESYKEKRKEEIKNHAIELENQIKEAWKNGNKWELKKFELKKQELKNELSEITWIKEWKKVEWWDIFWKLDQKIETNNT